MKLRVVGMLTVLSMAALSLGVGHADAQTKEKAAAKPKAPAKGAADKKEAAPTGPAKMKGKLALTPKGVTWGISIAQLAKIYDKVFDEEYMPLYKKVQPGPAMDALDAEVTDKKQLIRRNQINFGVLPTGVDQGPLKGEFSYGNKESMTSITLRTGVTRNFFFFDDKLWKVYDVHKYRKGGPYGENWDEAKEILAKKYGAAPAIVEADFAKGRAFEEMQWQDGTTVIRAINRAPTLGLAYQDANIYFNLAKHRSKKLEDPHKMDKDVASATAKPPPEEPKKDDKSKAAKDKGKVTKPPAKTK